MHGYLVGWYRHSSIHEGEKGGKNIQMEKIERTDTQTHEKIMNKSANNQLINHWISYLTYAKSGIDCREWHLY